VRMVPISFLLVPSPPVVIASLRGRFLKALVDLLRSLVLILGSTGQPVM